MFTQIAMAEKDQIYHRFIWRDGDSSLPVHVYQWYRILFGDKPSPDLAIYAIRFLADQERPNHPRGATILENETYVDDVGFSEGNAEAAACSMGEVDSILKKGKFNIKVWNSNEISIDQNQEENPVDELGHTWDKRRDTFRLKFHRFDSVDVRKLTKRGSLSLVAKTWDPLGIVLPVSIRFRIELQMLWEKGYGWDEVLPEKVAERWENSVHEMQRLYEVDVKRCVKPPDVIGLPQLHCFSDGGNDAYGTCAFLRWETKHGVDVRFVSAKAFVAPLKRKSTPRVELLGALAMSRMTSQIEKALGFQLEFKRFWIDSEVVIYWLLSESSRYKPFVSTRVQEFQDFHPGWRNEVRYVPSNDNSADCLTKPISVELLTDWHEGRFSKFLRDGKETWDSEISLDSIDEETMKDLLEIKAPPPHKKRFMRRRPQKVTNCLVNQEMVTATEHDASEGTSKYGGKIASYYSNWTRIVTAVAFVLKSLKIRRFEDSLLLSPTIVAEATKRIFLWCQEDLHDDVERTAKRFVKLQPFTDSDDFIRAKGRLRNIDLEYGRKHPILLPAEHPSFFSFTTENYCIRAIVWFWQI